jgi:hypothetical protein
VDRGGADAAEVHEQFAGEVVLLFWGSGEEGGPPRRKRRWLLNEALHRRGGGALRCLRRELTRSIYGSQCFIFWVMLCVIHWRGFL